MSELFSGAALCSMLGAFLATAGFSIVLGAYGKSILFDGLIGLLGWIIYNACIDMGTLLSTLLAGSCVSFLSQVGARFFRKPVTIFLVPGFFCLVPGALLYRMALAFLALDMTEAGQYAVQTLLTAGAIGVSIILVETVFTIESGIRRKRRGKV